MFTVTTSLMGVAMASMDDWGLQPNCQGSGCHEEWMESWTSCEGTYRATYRLRYLSIGILGIFFGLIGFQGVLSRTAPMVKSFWCFWVAITALLIVVYIADEAYVELCKELPRNMQLDVEMFISQGQYALMRAKGYKDLTHVRTGPHLNELVGFDWHLYYFLVYIVVVVILLTLARTIKTYSDNIDEGPVGLGANFCISTEPNAEIQVMADRMTDAVQDYYAAIPHYPGMRHLEDANAFPYLKKGRGPVPSINYGAMGIGKPPPPQD